MVAESEELLWDDGARVRTALYRSALLSGFDGGFIHTARKAIPSMNPASETTRTKATSSRRSRSRRRRGAQTAMANKRVVRRAVTDSTQRRLPHRLRASFKWAGVKECLFPGEKLALHPRLRPAHHHVNLPATAAGTDQPLPPIEHGGPSPVPSSHFGGIGLDLMLAFLAPNDQSDVGGGSVAERHWRAGFGFHSSWLGKIPHN
jgi:hypothetical protein